ncbi:MAG: hypothetical protein ABI986_14410 [Chloroflexota bacterium]
MLTLADLFYYIPAACPTDPTSAVDTTAAEIEVIDWCLVIRLAGNMSHKHELIEHDLTMN